MLSVKIKGLAAALTSPIPAVAPSKCPGASFDKTVVDPLELPGEMSPIRPDDTGARL